MENNIVQNEERIKHIVLKEKIFGTEILTRLLTFASLAGLIVVFSITSPYFFTSSNLISILLSTAVNGVLAIAVTLIIISGGIDLSVGTVMTLCSVMTAVFIVWLKLPIVVGVFGGILVGAFVGLVNGLIIVKMKVPSFVATLGMMMIARGLSLVITKSAPIYFTDNLTYVKISTGSFLFSIPNAALVFFVVAIIVSLLLSKTILGRYTYAIGGNREATRLSGIKVDLWNIVVYIVGGALVGIAGVLISARINSANPGMGAGYELDAIAAAVIGGTSLSGGQGTILGSVIGAFIMSVLLNGLRMLGVPPEWQVVLSGAIIILAVYSDNLRNRKV